MTQHVQINAATLAAARRRATARYAAEHVQAAGGSRLFETDDADQLLARAYRLRKKRLAHQASAARTSALLR